MIIIVLFGVATFIISTCLIGNIFIIKLTSDPPEWSDSISLALSAYLVFKLSKTKMEKANNQLKFIGRSKQNI